MATAAAQRLEDLNLTHDELEKLTEAFKKDEFRKLFLEYAEEISNPENRERYENEIRQMENDRGMDVKFINPEAGYVIKTTVDGHTKAFVNICKNDLIEKPSSVRQTGVDGRQGLFWSLPHSFSPPREDIGKDKEKCQVYDVVFHPDTYRMAETNSRFKQMVNDTALEGICKQFEVKLDMKNLKFPKMKYKGMPTPTVIRTRLPENAVTKKDQQVDGILDQFPYPYDNQTSEEKAMQKLKEIEKKQVANEIKQGKTKDTNKKVEIEEEYAVPKYCIRHQSEIDMQDFVDSPNVKTTTRPKALIVDVCLPLLSSATPIQLDILEKQLKLVSDNPAKYKLILDLPYPVDESKGSAKFDKVRRKLIVTLPVLPPTKVDYPQGEKVANAADNHDIDHLVGLTENCRSINGCSGDDVDAPLIEVISSHDIGESCEVDKIPGNHEKITETFVEVVGEKDVDQQNADSSISSLLYNSLVECVLPKFECHQDSSTIIFHFYASNIKQEFTSLTILSTHSSQLKIISIGDGGFPVYYSCIVKFNDKCHVADCGWNIVSSDSQVTMTAVKEESSKGFWDVYWIGAKQNCLEEQLYEHHSTLNSSVTVDSSKTVVSDVTPEIILPELVDVHTLPCLMKPDVHETDPSVSELKSDHDTSAAVSKKRCSLVGQSVNVKNSQTEKSFPMPEVGNSEMSVLLSELDRSELERDTKILEPSDNQVVDILQRDSPLKNDQMINDWVSDSVSELAESKIVEESQLSGNLSSKHVQEEAQTTDNGKHDVAEHQTGGVSLTSENKKEVNDQTQSTIESTQGPETMLSWKEEVRKSGAESQCAVSFSNNVIFDLDVD